MTTSEEMPLQQAHGRTHCSLFIPERPIFQCNLRCFRSEEGTMYLLTVPSLFIIFRRRVFNLSCPGSTDLQLELSFYSSPETHCSLFTPERPIFQYSLRRFRSEEGTRRLLTVPSLFTLFRRRVPNFVRSRDALFPLHS